MMCGFCYFTKYKEVLLLRYLYIIFCQCFVLLSVSVYGAQEDICDAKTDYFDTREKLSAANYGIAILELEAIKTCSENAYYTSYAHADLVYAYIQNGNINQAMALAESFISFYPNHESIDYVMYLRAMHFFYVYESSSIAWFSDDFADRNIELAEFSYNYLTAFIELYPESQYAYDAYQRLSYLLALFARYHIYVAEYYMQRGLFVAAANHAETVLEKYADTSLRKKALYISRDAYNAIGLDELVVKLDTVITANNY